MAPVAWRWLPLFTLVSCLLPLAAAGAPDPAAAALQAEARQWLARIQAAASSGNYQGTMVSSVGGTMSSSRVGHYVVGDQVYERVETLDGRQQRVARHNDAVHTLWPQAKLAVVEKRGALAGWSTTPQLVDPLALDQYEYRSEGKGRVAGRDAQIILLEPRDLLRYAQRFWADIATGLMLRADVIGAAAAPGALRPVLESTAFSEIAINVRPQPEQVLQDLREPLDRYKVVRPQQQRTMLDVEGWAVARPVPGFRLAGCVRRGMETTGEGGDPVLQAVFSDGLTHVSVFIEPYKPQLHRGEMQAQRGATSTMTQKRGEHWLTIVGDVPAATLKLFADALERRKP